MKPFPTHYSTSQTLLSPIPHNPSFISLPKSYSPILHSNLITTYLTNLYSQINNLTMHLPLPILYTSNSSLYSSKIPSIPTTNYNNPITTTNLLPKTTALEQIHSIYHSSSPKPSLSPPHLLPPTNPFPIPLTNPTLHFNPQLPPNLSPLTSPSQTPIHPSLPPLLSSTLHN
jgi:hypothetical protein